MELLVAYFDFTPAFHLLQPFLWINSCTH